jgi:Zn-dependent protease with chaperone function
MLKQQISGIVNLSVPLILIYAFYPAFLGSLSGKIICSVVIGLYLFIISYKGLMQLTRTLQFVPTGAYKEKFEDLIRSCDVDPSTIILKYAYTNEFIAMAADTTIIVDPIVWHGLVDDPQVGKVEEIFKVHIEPNLTILQKERIAAIHGLLTLPTQRFIFRHELGHVARYFSYKKLVVIFLIGFLATYSGIVAAMVVLQIHGLLAILVGMFVGGSVDLFLTYGSNLIFKLQEEKAADRFAVRYSSNEEIQAAALFFKQYQNFLDTHKLLDATATKMPLIFQGYQHGADRSAYLLQLLSKK